MMGLVVPKYIVIDNDTPMKTEFEYGVGEVITVNSTGKAKCVRKETIDGRLIHYFRSGRCVWIFDE